jgi:hypothetical protein
MANLNVNDKFLLTIKGELCGQTIMSTFGYVVQTVAANTSQHSAFDLLDQEIVKANQLIPAYRACIPTNYHMLQTWWQVFSPQRYAAYKIAKDLPGLWPVAATTANVSANIVRRGDFATRRDVSSLHVPISPDDTSVVDGMIGNILKPLLTTLAAELIQPLEAVIPQLLCNPIIPNDLGAGQFTLVTNSFAMNTSRVMRRRTVGLGI